jgi:hypothetical protein
MVSKKQGMTILGLLAVLGAGTYTISTGDINIGNTIGQIGDNIVNNYVQEQLGIDVDKFKENCEKGIYEGKESQMYCDLV